MKLTKLGIPWKPSPKLTDEQVGDMERTILDVGKMTRRPPKVIATKRGMRMLREAGAKMGRRKSRC